jgi:predicted outer membrane repeat protein
MRMKAFFVIIVSVIAFCLPATIINIPVDQPTIQAGIDVAVDADIILVQPGTYYENINYSGKNITVASLFLTSQDTTYISQTIIDGNQAGSVVTFENGEDSTAVLCGFTITNGESDFGGGIRCSNSDVNLQNLNIIENSSLLDGGGIYCHISEPIIRSSTISSNSSIYYGGGIYCEYSEIVMQNLEIFGNSSTMDGGGIYCLDSEIVLDNVSIHSNTASQNGGGIFSHTGSATSFDPENRCSIYSNLSGSEIGNDIYLDIEITTYVIVDTFTVLYSSDYYTYPLANFSFDILNTAQDDLLEADLYVSPTGDNSNSGLNENEAFQTIQYALSKIYVNEQNPHTIHLLPGTYSPQTNGEVYPLYMINYVSIEGYSETESILDANDTNMVFKLHHITNSTISDLTVTNGNSFYGGGIYCYYSDLILQNITVSCNSATYTGGGIHCWYSNPNIINSFFYDNLAGENGGGIYCYFSDPNIDTVIFEENYAINGGGFYCEDSNPNLINLDLNNNHSYNGTGIYGVDSEIYMQNVELSDQYAHDNGGGIYIDDTIMISDNISITNIESFAKGGGIYCCNNSILNMENSIIRDNIVYCDDGGGGLYCEDSTINLLNVIIDDNYTESAGGGIYINDSFLSLINAEIINNDAYGNGGGIYCDNDSELEISSSSIINNDGEYGGGLYCDDSQINIENTTISSNEAHEGNGGGIYCAESNLSLHIVEINNNESNEDGGGIYCEDSDLILENVTIAENAADIYGGGIYVNNSDPILVNVDINNNNSIEGAGIYCDDSDPEFINITIAENTAIDFGGGIYCIDDADPSLINCILFENQPQQVYFSPELSSSEITILYSDIQGGEAGIVTNNNGTVEWEEGNIDLDPIFFGTGDHPFSLTQYSPCLNIGIPDTTGLNLPEFDLAGNPRIYFDIIDMGAYEYQGVPFGAEFEADVIIGLTPLEVQFTDLSTGNIVYWGWDFDDDGIIDSNEQNPTFIYNYSGNYKVTLMISDGTYTDTETKINYITVGDELIADFEADFTSGFSPLEVQFTDLSIGGFTESDRLRKKLPDKSERSREITSWEWDFESDGTIDSNDENPIHTYTLAGVYTVSLTVSDGTHFDTEVKLDYINVTGTGINEELPLTTELIDNHPRYDNQVCCNTNVLVCEPDSFQHQMSESKYFSK